jgi:hypothetical protein
MMYDDLDDAVLDEADAGPLDDNEDDTEDEEEVLA